jgi:hypothetical protein
MRQAQRRTIIIEGDRLRVDVDITVAELKRRYDIPLDDDAGWWDGNHFRPLRHHDTVERILDGAPVVFSSTDDETLKLLLEHGKSQDPDGLPAPTFPEQHR